MATAKKSARRPRKQYTDEEKADFKEKREAELTEIAKSIDEGVMSFRNSDRYREYLASIAAFPTYSYRNIMLIVRQNPKATYVAGFNKWKEMGRHVKKGEKGLRILAPLARKVQDTQRDDSTKTEQTDDQKKVIYGFRLVSVFDASQTEGDPLPTPTIQTDQALDHPEALLRTLQAISDVPVTIVKQDVWDQTQGENVKGYFSREGLIAIRGGMPDAMTAETMIHEMAHSILHNANSVHQHDQRRIKEFDAESVAFVVCKHLGINTDNFSFPYLNSWTEDQTPDVLRQELPLIVKTASTIIERLDSQLEREILHEQAQTEIAPGNVRVWQVTAEDRDSLHPSDVVSVDGTANKAHYSLVYEGKLDAYGEAADGQTAKDVIASLEDNKPGTFDNSVGISIVELREKGSDAKAWCMMGGEAVPLLGFSQRNQPELSPKAQTAAKKKADIAR